MKTFKAAKFFALLTLIASLTVLFSCSKAPEGYLRYSNSGAEFSIVYPDDWELRSYEGSLINFFSPAADASDSFFENISVVTIPLVGYDLNSDGIKDKITLAQYVELSKNDISEYIQDYNEESSQAIKIGDVFGRRLVYTGKAKEEAVTGEEGDATESETMTYRWIQVISVYNEVAYIITYTSYLESPAEYEAIFDKMIENCVIG